MNPLLLSGFGTSIGVDKRKLIIRNKLANERLEFYPHQINHDSIILDGHTGNITFEAIRWLMKHDITITMLNWNGNLLGVTLPQGPKNGKLRVKQYTKYTDAKSRYYIAEQIVHTKIANTLQLLQQLSSFYDCINLHEMNNIVQNNYNCNKEKKYHARNANCNNKSSMENNENMKTKMQINILMNYEGRIATAYWNNIANIVNKLYPEFHFQSRKNKSYSWNMNASDEINALFNYGYAILESETRRAINAVGLDPTTGFLHELAESKEPLVYDMQELLRWLVDLSVIQLLEEKKLKKSNFITTENYHIRLKDQTANALVEKIALNMNSKDTFKGRNATYQTILYNNIQFLAYHLLDKNKRLDFDVPTLTIKRNDSLEVSQRILSMTPDERKKLRISKSGLWYQRKKLTEGKAIKVYDKVLSKLNQSQVGESMHLPRIGQDH